MSKRNKKQRQTKQPSNTGNIMSGALKITASSGQTIEHRSCPGLFDCLLTHKVSETSAQFNWTGPKMSKEMWQEILAFFKWTYDTEKSEAQVRLFVHPQQGWMAWAFPQKGGTSMTTKEEEGDEFAKQRAEKIPEGFVAFGTVHHHCSTVAFQSGTDTHDEVRVDGIHITIGKMDSVLHDMHVRFYLKGNKFDVNMSYFWEIGEEMLAKSKELSEMFGVVADLDRVARTQMCKSVEKDHPFNVDWKANYILPQRTIQYGFPAVAGATWCTQCMAHTINCAHKNYQSAYNLSHKERAIVEMMDDLEGEMFVMGYGEGELGLMILSLEDKEMEPLVSFIEAIKKEWNVSVKDVIDYIKEKATKEATKYTKTLLNGDLTADERQAMQEHLEFQRESYWEGQGCC